MDISPGATEAAQSAAMKSTAAATYLSSAGGLYFGLTAEWFAAMASVAIAAITPQWKHNSDDYLTFECRVDAAGGLGRLSRFVHSVERDPAALKL